MSGGFFRGTSADQDTRFSNKQAKLLKSQKFASELEHLVDMTRVKMDVMRPWIAQRVTELLGFEDEVLINFIYGLLEGKEVNGKEVQISLTGFMEKNTGKFMKELWQLLLSAQNNSSGVPQQFLDAKQEETRKNKAETDRIKSEMQKKKEEEGREIEEEKMRKLDGEAEKQRVNNATLEPSLKHHPEAFTVHSADDKEIGDRNGVRGRSRVSKSPHSLDRVPLSPRRRRSRSMSKSFSNSRSYSEERRESRGLSRSPSSRGRSISSERVPDSPPRRSIRPRRQHSPMRSRSPPIRRSSHSRRRSTSRSRRLSPSPVRRRMRTPSKYRSRSPIRRRSRTPVRHRSRSPLRHRSRSPMRRRYRTPVRRRSRTPMRGRSPSPFRRRYRRSPSTPLRRSPSPVQRRSRISNRRRSLTPSPPRYRSPSREEFSSPSPVRRLSPSSVKKGTSKCQGSPVSRPRERTRAVEKFSPVYHARRGGSVENSDEIRKGLSSPVHRPSVSLRSPQRDFRVLGNTCRKEPSSSPSPYRSQFHSELPPVSRSPNEDKRSYSPYQSPVMQSKGRKGRDTRENYAQKPKDQRRHYDIPESTKEGELDRARDNGDQKFKSLEGRPATSSKLDTRKDVERVDGKHDYSPERSVGRHSSEARNHSDGLELRKKGLETKSAKISTKVINQEDSVEGKRGAISNDSKQADEKVRFLSDKAKHSKWLYETESAVKSAVEVDEKDGSGSLSSGSDYSFKRRSKGHEHRKHRRSGKKAVTSDDSYDSELEDRKEAKRRKKEKKRLKKEERRRRREERRRRREERRAEKLKAKSKDASDAEETVSEQKKLEMQLREKALESLRAKKGVGH